MVVSDGMGSRPYARDGSHAACRAVVDAVRLWRRFPDAPLDILLGLVHLLWRARISPKSPEDCACTCLFVVVDPEGSGIAAQLGDGLILFQDGEKVSPLTTRSPVKFSNETKALGLTSRLSAWNKFHFEKCIRSIVLCTDGVADDLLADRYGDFVNWLTTDIRRERPKRRWRLLERALRDWPTPNHLDDKTIAVVHVGGVADDNLHS